MDTLAPETTSSQHVTEEHDDLRLEMRVKNNVLWHAIFDQYPSVAALCRAHPELTHQQQQIGQLLRFKICPFKKKTRKRGDWYYADEYRSLCLVLERILKIPAEELFPRQLYLRLVGGVTEQAVEMSSFSALPFSAQKELLLLPTPPEDNPEAAVDQALLREKLGVVLKALTYREREIIKLRYGLGGQGEYTLLEIAKIFDVSPEMVRQIALRALRHLQHPCRSNQLRDFLE